MARTPTVSDEEIFAAAARVMGERGVDGFTISDVAAATGLSRAAIILRFESTRALKITLLTRQIEAFTRALAELPQTPSGNSLLAISAFIAGKQGNPVGQASFFSNYAVNMQDAELAALEKRRGEVFHAAIARAMPETRLDKSAAVTEFVTHLTGSIISWIGSGSADPRRFMLARTRNWLTLAGIPCDDAAPCESPGTGSALEMTAS